MITTEFFYGRHLWCQGLGNQLWVYAVTRTIALDLGYDFGIENPGAFKGSSFMNIDFGKTPEDIKNFYVEKRVNHPYLNNCNISKIDSRLLHIHDNTKISGIMQAEDYIKHRKVEISKWFEIKKYNMPVDLNNCCIVNFRGGDFKTLERFIRGDFYKNAINYVKTLLPDIKFYIVTDDPVAVREFLDFEIIGRSVSNIDDIGFDYAILNNAKFLIIPNSSFSWWAAWTNTNANIVIAPMFWTAYNFSDGFWSSGDALTRNWIYIDRENRIMKYEQCLKNKLEYEHKHSVMWQ